MTTLPRRYLIAGVVLACTAPAMAQEPTPIPAAPATSPSPAPGRSIPAEPASPVIFPEPVVTVPPAGPMSPAPASPLDPVALHKRHTSFFAEKVNSWHWHRLQGKMLGYPEEWQARPLGAAQYEVNTTMVSNSAAARLVLHDYDFIQGESQLSPYGRERLSKLTGQLAASQFPLIVERNLDRPALSEARRYAVLAALASGPYPVSSDRVLVGVPRARGISGIEAYIMGNNVLDRVNNYGPPIPLLSNGINGATGVTSSTGQ
jgi:hypothetical protein